MSQLAIDIWRSFRSLPAWVQVWMAAILMPVNLLSICFLHEPGAILIAILAIGGMLPNLGIIIFERGLSKMMSIPHLLPWTALVVIIILDRPEAGSLYDQYLLALAIVNCVSLAFDYPDSIKWLKGDRKVAG